MRRSAAWGGFRSVLCTVDFSEPSALALQYAARLAQRNAAPLTTLHVADPLLTAAASAALGDRDLPQRSERELERFADSYLAGPEFAGLSRSARVVVGSPAEEILAAAAGSDVIVLGTAGLTGARRLFMGSTTLSVLQRSGVPVLAVPPAAGAPAAEWPGSRIVFAASADERTRAELAAAAGLAAWFGATLVVVHVAAAPDEPRAASQLEAMAADVRERVAVTVRVVSGEVGERVAAIATNESAGLVVTMLRDREGWFGPQRGSMSYHVVTQSIAPVLAMPPASVEALSSNP
jgi:nucleotide-binding universal stress UspA family protein